MLLLGYCLYPQILMGRLLTIFFSEIFQIVQNRALQRSAETRKCGSKAGKQAPCAP